MSDIIALITKKGGSGKTTTAQALTAGFTAKGLKVLAVDLDGQANLTYSMGVNADGVTIFDVLTGAVNIRDAVHHTDRGDIIAANSRLDLADMKLTGAGRNLLLKNVLEGLRLEYDLIILDTLPFFGVLTLNALAASNGVIIPAKADVFNLNMFKRTCDMLNSVHQALNADLKLYGVLLTHFKPNTKNTRDLLGLFEQEAKEQGTHIFNSKIRETVSIQTAQAMQKDILTYQPKSNAAQDYNAFIDELESLIKNGDNNNG